MTLPAACMATGSRAAGGGTMRLLVIRNLTFDMRGGRQQAKPDVGRPLDGRVSRLGEHTWPCTWSVLRLAAACPRATRRGAGRLHLRRPLAKRWQPPEFSEAR